MDIVETNTELNNNLIVRDWALYAKKIKNLKPKGIDVLNLDFKEDASLKKMLSSWEPFDFTLNGCKKITINAFAISNNPHAEELKNYSLQKFKDRKIIEWKDKAVLSNFTEYVLTNNKCYYITFQAINSNSTENSSMFYEFVDVKADIIISGFLFVKHPDANLKNTEATLKKIIDYLNS